MDRASHARGGRLKGDGELRVDALGGEVNGAAEAQGGQGPPEGVAKEGGLGEPSGRGQGGMTLG